MRRPKSGVYIDVHWDEWRGVVDREKISVGHFMQTTSGDAHGSSLRLTKKEAYALLTGLTNFFLKKRAQKVWVKEDPK